MNDNLPTGFRDRLLTELRALPTEEVARPAPHVRRLPVMLATASVAVAVAATGTLLLAPQLHNRARQPDAAGTATPVPAAFTVVKNHGIVTLTFFDLRRLREEANRARLRADLREEGVLADIRYNDDCVTIVGNPDRPDLGRELIEALDHSRQAGPDQPIIRIDPSKIRPGDVLLLDVSDAPWGLQFGVAIYTADFPPTTVPCAWTPLPSHS